MNRTARTCAALALALLASLTLAAAPASASKQAQPRVPAHLDTQARAAAHAPAPAAPTSKTTARSGEGIIAITSRTCGSSSTWKANAQSNGITSPRYLVRLGQRLDITCSDAPRARSAPRTATKPTLSAWRTPLSSYSLTSCYGPRWGTQHQGIDLAAGYGTPIRAAHSGKVSRAGWVWSGYGISVVLANGSGVWTHYAHMSRTAVKAGQRVKAGQVIGYVGMTGDTTGPHLHFEVARSAGVLGAQINPAPFLRNHGVRVGC